MPAHPTRLTAGAYAASLREGAAKAATPALKAALAAGPLSLADLAAQTGHGFPVVAAAVRSQPKKFREAEGKVHRIG